MQVQTKVKGHISSYKSITYSSPFTITHKFQKKIACSENTFHFDYFGTPIRANRNEIFGTNLFLNGFRSSICSNFLFRFRSLIKPMSKSGFTFESFKNLSSFSFQNLSSRSSFSLKNLSNSIAKFHPKILFEKSSFLNSLGVEGVFEELLTGLRLEKKADGYRILSSSLQGTLPRHG